MQTPRLQCETSICGAGGRDRASLLQLWSLGLESYADACGHALLLPGVAAEPCVPLRDGLWVQRGFRCQARS